MALDRLPNEILLMIMNYLDMSSLIKLKCVCKRYYSLINSCDLLTKKSNHLLVTNQVSEEFRKRCRPLLSSYSSKFITHDNWINKIHKKEGISTQFLHINRLQLTQNNLLFCSGKYLNAYNRNNDGTINKSKKIEIRTCEDITSMVCCNDVLISGHSEGNIRLWRMESINNENYFKSLAHYRIYKFGITLDATSNCIAVSLVNAIKIHKYTYEENVLEEGNKIFDDGKSRVTSLTFDPTGTKIAWMCIGKYRKDNFGYLSIYDINQNYRNDIVESKLEFNGDLLWEDPYTILTRESTQLKKMDIRTSKLVRMWDAPDDCNFLCSSSDNLYTIITGTNNNKVILWDQRKNAPVQEYAVVQDIHATDIRIYSLSFDSSHLYIAFHEWYKDRMSSTASTIYEFNFKNESNLKKNNFVRKRYRNCNYY